MKGDQRLRREQLARKEMNHARRQVEFYQDKLILTGQTQLYEAAYRKTQLIYRQRLAALEDLENPGSK